MASRRINVFLVTVTLAGGLGFTAIGAYFSHRGIQIESRLRFDRFAERLGNEVQRRVNQTVYGLKGARGMYVASQQVDRKEFRAYVASRELEHEFPGTLGFGFIQRVLRSDLAQFVAAERADNAPDFEVRTAGDAPDLYVIKFIEPLQANRQAWGIDVGSEPRRREAIETAIRTGQPTLTSSLSLAQDQRARAGFLYLVPVFHPGAAVGTPAERFTALIGLAYAPIVIDGIFRGVMVRAENMLDVEVFEGSTPDAASLLLDADDIPVAVSGDGPPYGGRLLHRVREITVGGRTWTLVMTTTPKFEVTVDRRTPLLIGIGGGLVTLVLTGMVLVLGRSRTRALELAQAMTASLRTSEAEAKRLAMVASRTSNAVAITDADGRIQWLNDGFTRVTGYTLDEVRGRTPGSFLQGPDSDPATVVAMHDAINRGEGFKVEIINYHKSGRSYWIDIEVQPLRDDAGALTGFMAIESDITERKAAQQRVEASERQLSALTREVPGVIFQFEVKPDGQRAFVFLSDAYRELFGREPAEAKARPAMLFTTVHPADLRGVRASLEDAIAQGTPWIHTFRIAKPDGTLRWIDAHSSFGRQPDGTKVWFGVLTNITALQEARHEAEQAQLRAEQANRAKSQFLAMMSHEIRTPMNGVIGMTSLLLDTSLTKEQREYAEIIRYSGDSLLTLINDILDFSKIESGRLDLETEAFSLRDCIESTLDLLTPKATKQGIDLLYEIGEGVPNEVRGDVTRLRQILVNLVGNALKFTERGEVELTVKALTAEDGARELQFAVRDTGVGIAPEAQGRLFQSFTQVDASTTRKYGGTGLGLAISKRLAELMGGRMWLESEPGRGSTFFFTVRLEWVAPGVRRYHSVARPHLEGRRLLIVDDSATSRRILATLAEKWSMTASVLGAGAEALEQVRAGARFDVALFDMQMPAMDGIMLAREIRQLPGGQALPLILLSSIGRPPGPETSQLFAAVLTKPAKPSQIHDAISSLLGGPAPVTSPIAPTPTPVGQTQSERLLLAEDNSVNQKVALHMLARLGYRADNVANGLEAVAAVSSRPYDIVLMDVQMPEMDGFEATRKIKTGNPVGGRVPWIIALTANAMEGDRERCLEAGMDDYLGKPIKSAELAAALERARAALRSAPSIGPV